MNRQQLRDHIYDLIPSEEERLKTGRNVPSKFYQYLDTLGMKDSRGIYMLPDSHFFIPTKTPDFSIWNALNTSPHQAIVTFKRASRFYQEPMAYANFIAIRYCYSGTSHIKTLEHEFDLHENDLCLLSNGFALSQQLNNREDLVFTIMFEKEYLLKNILRDIEGSGIITRFVLNYICGNRNPQNYIIFHGDNNDRIKHVIEDMVCEYIDPSENGGSLIETYVKLLIFQMIGSRYDYEETPESHLSYQIASILSKIDRDYKTITLSNLADYMGYNTAYLSRMIKQETGQNFKDLVMNKRLEHAAVLLKNSTLSIQDIITRCGLVNETHFYKKFSIRYGCSPRNYREDAKKQNP